MAKINQAANVSDSKIIEIPVSVIEAINKNYDEILRSSANRRLFRRNLTVQDVLQEDHAAGRNPRLIKPLTRGARRGFDRLPFLNIGLSNAEQYRKAVEDFVKVIESGGKSPSALAETAAKVAPEVFGSLGASRRYTMGQIRPAYDLAKCVLSDYTLSSKRSNGFLGMKVQSGWLAIVGLCTVASILTGGIAWAVGGAVFGTIATVAVGAAALFGGASALRVGYLLLRGRRAASRALTNSFLQFQHTLTRTVEQGPARSVERELGNKDDVGQGVERPLSGDFTYGEEKPGSPPQYVATPAVRGIDDMNEGFGLSIVA